MKDFYNATGINLRLINSDYSAFGDCVGVSNSYCTEIQNIPDGNHSCLLSDKMLLEKCRQTRQMQMHVCHAGLIDIAVPIIHDNEILAFILLGQMRKELDFSAVENQLKALPLNLELMKKYYATLQLYEHERIKSVASIAEMLAKYILLEHLLKPNYNKLIERAVEYINRHLEHPLSVQQIAEHTHISKSALYRNFQTAFGCTLSEYINTQRIKHAAELLQTSELSVEEIAQRVGFSGNAYFSKIFKKEKGVSPSKFRSIFK